MDSHPFHLKIDLIYLYNLSPHNDKCVDCNSKYPMFISINNAVMLCPICAKKHLQYGYNVSYIRSINDKYDLYLLNYIQRGGNERYLRYCEETGLNTINSEERYNTYGMEYYRVLVCIMYIYIYIC